MKLTLVISSLSAGGAERVMSIMANYWAKKGWTITLLTFDDGTTSPFYELDDRVRHKALGVARVSTNIWQGLSGNLKRVLTLRRQIRNSDPDAVISFLDRTNVVVLLATRGMNVPVLVSERSNPLLFAPSKSWQTLQRWVYPHADAVIMQTERAATHFSYLPQGQVRIISNPVMTPDLQKRSSSLRLPEHTIVSMGRFTEEKRFDLLIRAFASLSRSYPQWHLAILGDGPLHPELERLTNELGVSDRVLLPGRIKHPHALLSQAAIFVLSSRFEGFPNALCEAMACGLAVISTDCPSGPREIIREGIDGLLVPNEDVDALADAMSRLMANEDQRKKLSARAPEVIERFGLDQVMGMWEKVIAEACP